MDEELTRLSHIYPNVLLVKSVVMPNHVHLILHILESESGRPQAAPTVSHILNQFKGRISKHAGFPLWQKGFYDHVIRSEADYLRIWNYIDTNPAKWADDCYFSNV